MKMPILEEMVKDELKGIFKDLKNPVKLVVFSYNSRITVPGIECPTCRENNMLMEEVAALSEKITVEVYDFLKDKEKVQEYKIDRIPATVIEGEKNYDIRIYGIPASYEFSTLISAIKVVSNAKSELSEETKEKLKLMSNPVHIQVFITLNCPYCASAAGTAHQMALESDKIRADIIDAQEFPELAQRYNVYAVPRVVVNETTQFEGALPEDKFLEKVNEAVEIEK
jgi:glutaredoxin-like protein